MFVPSSNLFGTASYSVVNPVNPVDPVDPHYPDYNPTFCDFCQYDCVAQRGTDEPHHQCKEMNWGEIDVNLGWQYCDCIRCKERFKTNKPKYSIDIHELKSNLVEQWKLIRCVRPKITSEFIVHLSSVDLYTIKGPEDGNKKPNQHQTAFTTHKSILLRDFMSGGDTELN
jgi:hypothetical protein